MRRTMLISCFPVKAFVRRRPREAAESSRRRENLGGSSHGPRHWPERRQSEVENVDDDHGPHHHENQRKNMLGLAFQPELIAERGHAHQGQRQQAPESRLRQPRLEGEGFGGAAVERGVLRGHQRRRHRIGLFADDRGQMVCRASSPIWALLRPAPAKSSRISACRSGSRPISAARGPSIASARRSSNRLLEKDRVNASLTLTTTPTLSGCGPERALKRPPSQ